MKSACTTHSWFFLRTLTYLKWLLANGAHRHLAQQQLYERQSVPAEPQLLLALESRSPPQTPHLLAQWPTQSPKSPRCPFLRIVFLSILWTVIGCDFQRPSLRRRLSRWQPPQRSSPWRRWVRWRMINISIREKGPKNHSDTERGPCLGERGRLQGGGGRRRHRGRDFPWNRGSPRGRGCGNRGGCWGGELTVLSIFVQRPHQSCSCSLPYFSDHYLVQVAEEVASEEENAVEEVEAPAEESSPQ